MIKIRYADLPQGLHADVRSSGRRPVIYLLPGLSPAQRRDALRRLIRTSRQGRGPRLRAAGVAFAVARDVAKSTARNGLAAVRCHPAGSAVLAAVVTAAVVCYALFITVTVRFGPRPGMPPAAGAPPSWPQDAGGAGRSPGGGSTAPAGTRPGLSGKYSASPGASAPGAGTGTSGSGPSGAGSGPPGSGPSGGPTSPAPLPTGTWSAPGGVLPSASAGPSPGPSSSPSPVPSPAPPPARPGPARGNPGGLCLQVGPLGVCISG